MAAGVGEATTAGAAGAATAAMAKWCAVATAMLGPPTVGTSGLELTTGGDEVRRTRGLKEWAPRVFAIARL